MTGVLIRASDKPCPDEVKAAALAALRTQTENTVGAIQVEGKPLLLLAWMEDRIVGGVSAKAFYNWLYIALVWVEEEFRGRGIGTDLMNCAEQEARHRKLTGIYLWTESWQAPVFYSKLGYTQFVEFKNCPPGHTRIGFCKYLA